MNAKVKEPNKNGNIETWTERIKEDDDDNHDHHDDDDDEVEAKRKKECEEGETQTIKRQLVATKSWEDLIEKFCHFSVCCTWWVFACVCVSLKFRNGMANVLLPIRRMCMQYASLNNTTYRDSGRWWLSRVSQSQHSNSYLFSAICRFEISIRWPSI